MKSKIFLVDFATFILVPKSLEANCSTYRFINITAILKMYL